MKKIIFIIAVVALVAGCSKSNRIQFCEGASPEGKGINCGSTFEDGELTALITSEEPFGVKSISVQVYRAGESASEKVETVTADVRPDEQTALVNLSFYTGGTYQVKALKNNTQFSEGTIVIVEQ
ncbi:MAG: membrane lipoprotein lipid attachment site-containing protein [Spirochaetes bacterium]|nr:membrane lipoprotein lipid attachment site-containing protein [Spirochaetota bacterium]